MAQQTNAQRFKQPWTPFQLKKLKLYGKPWKAGDRAAPSVAVHVVNGNPRFRLFMNQGGTNSLPIAFDPIIFNTLLQALLSVANKESSKLSMHVKAYYDKGQKLEKLTTISAVTVGRDQTGCVYLAIQFRGSDLAVFPFTPSFYAELISENGEPLTADLASTLVARGWVTQFQHLVNNYLLTIESDPEMDAADKADNGNGGGNNYKPNNNYNQPTAASPAKTTWDDDDAFSTDIPF